MFEAWGGNLALTFIYVGSDPLNPKWIATHNDIDYSIYVRNTHTILTQDSSLGHNTFKCTDIYHTIDKIYSLTGQSALFKAPYTQDYIDRESRTC